MDRAAAAAPDARAVRDDTGSWTYRELLAAAERVAGWLRYRGLGHGDRLLTFLPNSRHLLAILYGALRSGIILVPVSSQARPYQLQAIIRDCEPRLILAESPDAPRTAATIPPEHRVAGLDELLGEWETIDRPTADTVVDPSDVAVLIYTSGSTAGPKGVVSRHRQVTFATRAIAARLAYRPDDVVFCRLPLSFDYGLYQAFLCAEAGAELVVSAAHDELSVYRSMRDSGATVLPLVPPAALTLLRLAGRQDTLRPRLITNTGAELTSAVAARLREAFPGVSIVAMYGMTECKRITIASPDADLVKPNTVGTALPGTHVEVVGPDGETLPTGMVGEIVVRGPHVMDGYWADPEASARRFPVDSVTGERRLRTGDHGFLDDDGALTFVGRRDDIFKRNGVRTSLNEIEAAALDVPGVLEAAAALVGRNQECVLWIQSALRPERVMKEVADRLGTAKVPDRCLIVRAMPRTTSGKIDKVQLGADLVVTE
ncbi:class I adenylate-forming enzyme family protein [Nonomuraea sp. NPDC052265]|uniref:class I adenylate-forming enzyme family protein n=1 Tax=Nonomuraea sp. NPDC052265 TaxID=3364374 RepID=UPI0037CA18A0